MCVQMYFTMYLQEREAVLIRQVQTTEVPLRSPCLASPVRGGTLSGHISILSMSTSLGRAVSISASQLNLSQIMLCDYVEYV